MDILSLYDIAEALDVKITQLLYLPLDDYTHTADDFVPAFFNGLNHVYMYYFDGRSNDVNRCVIDIAGETEPGVYQAHLYMNVKDFNHYALCENVYEGTISHYTALSLLLPEPEYGNGPLSDRCAKSLHEFSRQMGACLWHFQPTAHADFNQSSIIQNHPGRKAGICEESASVQGRYSSDEALQYADDHVGFLPFH